MAERREAITLEQVVNQRVAEAAVELVVELVVLVWMPLADKLRREDRGDH